MQRRDCDTSWILDNSPKSRLLLRGENTSQLIGPFHVFPSYILLAVRSYYGIKVTSKPCSPSSLRRCTILDDDSHQLTRSNLTHTHLQGGAGQGGGEGKRTGEKQRRRRKKVQLQAEYPYRSQPLKKSAIEECNVTPLLRPARTSVPARTNQQTEPTLFDRFQHLASMLSSICVKFSSGIQVHSYLSFLFTLLYFTLQSGHRRAARQVMRGCSQMSQSSLALDLIFLSPYLRSIDLRNVKSLLVCLNRKDITHDVT